MWDKSLGNTVILHKAFPPSFQHSLRRTHGGIKPPELCQYLIETFSKKNATVLDPFVGVGGTLLGASLADRKAIGIDINQKWKEIYETVCEREKVSKQLFVVGDSQKVLLNLPESNSIDLLLTDVPFWEMDKLKKTRGKFSRAGEPSKERLPSALHQFHNKKFMNLDEWLNLLESVFRLSLPKLCPGSPVLVFIGNMYRNIIASDTKKKVGRYLRLSSYLASRLIKLGFEKQGEIIWYSPDKKLGVYGYPYAYIPSIVDQRILVFRKPI